MDVSASPVRILKANFQSCPNLGWCDRANVEGPFHLHVSYSLEVKQDLEGGSSPQLWQFSYLLTGAESQGLSDSKTPRTWENKSLISEGDLSDTSHCPGKDLRHNLLDS